MRALVTGALGNLGVSVTKRLLDEGYQVTGVDNNSRNALLGGDVKDNVKHLKAYFNNAKFILNGLNIVEAPWHKIKGDFDVIVHCAAQVSHPKSIEIPDTDFMINALGTFKLLNHTRRNWPNAKFIHIGTAKIYGENVDKLWPYEEQATRYWYQKIAWVDDFKGVSEHCSFDQTMKTPFGCSKACADLYVQEFAYLYGLKTVVLRPGVFTGQYAKPVIWQNWVGDLMKEVLTQDQVDIIGWNGKQVRDVLHTEDLVDAIMLMIRWMPAKGEVFNIGGGMNNAISVLEAFHKICVMTQKWPELGFLPKREGDWQVYVTDNSKLQKRYPQWSVTRDLDYIFNEALECYRSIASD